MLELLLEDRCDVIYVPCLLENPSTGSQCMIDAVWDTGSQRTAILYIDMCKPTDNRIIDRNVSGFMLFINNGLSVDVDGNALAVMHRDVIERWCPHVVGTQWHTQDSSTITNNRHFFIKTIG